MIHVEKKVVIEHKGRMELHEVAKIAAQGLYGENVRNKFVSGSTVEVIFINGQRFKLTVEEVQ